MANEITNKTATISDEEVQQLLRTVEMFEAIIQVQQDDYQSLEILKEAYLKLGRKEDSLAASRKLIIAYEKQGQVFKAILECESILNHNPEENEIRHRLTQLETQANSAMTEQTSGKPFSTSEAQFKPASRLPSKAASTTAPADLASEGDKAMADVLLAEKLATPQALQPLLQQLKSLRGSPHPGKGQPLALIQFLINEQFAKLEDVMNIVLNRSALPYIPLGNYDVERETACLLPLDLCWQCCLVPFDQIGRCVLIATANPFAEGTRRLIESKLRLNLFWYLSPPAEIATTLRRAHRIENATPSPAKS